MKIALLLSVLTVTAVNAQNFSPSASGNPVGSPSALGSQASAASTLGSPSAIGSDSAAGSSAVGTNNGTSTFNNNPGSTIIDQPIGDGRSSPLSDSILNQTNTAPTAIPSDTTLQKTPSGNPRQQSQEEFNSFPDSTVAPGTGSGPGAGPSTNSDIGTGTGTVNDIDAGSPATSP